MQYFYTLSMKVGSPGYNRASPYHSIIIALNRTVDGGGCYDGVLAVWNQSRWYTRTNKTENRNEMSKQQKERYNLGRRRRPNEYDTEDAGGAEETQWTASDLFYTVGCKKANDLAP